MALLERLEVTGCESEGQQVTLGLQGVCGMVAVGPAWGWVPGERGPCNLDAVGRPEVAAQDIE